MKETPYHINFKLKAIVVLKEVKW